MVKPKLFKLTNSAYFQHRQLQGQLKYFSKEFDVVAVAPAGEDWEALLSEQQVRGIAVDMARNINPIRDLQTIRCLIKIFRQERPDIVHTHTPKAGLLGMIAAWMTRVPVRMHTVTGFPLTIATGWKKRVLWLTEWLTYSCATHVYPNSHRMLKIIEEMGLSQKSKMKVIGNGSSNGIDTGYFSSKAVSEVKFSSYPFVFGFVGRIFYEKGINELIGAFVRLQKEYPEIIGLRLIGFMEEGLYPVDEWVKKEIECNTGIEYVGYQSDVRPYLLGCQAFVFPSYREGFPNVVMQAGSLGLAQIVSDINGCNEIIIPEVNGVIIPPQDEEALYQAMKRFVQNPNMVRGMSSRARGLITSRYERREIWKLMNLEYMSALSSVGRVK